MQIQAFLWGLSQPEEGLGNYRGFPFRAGDQTSVGALRPWEGTPKSIGYGVPRIPEESHDAGLTLSPYLHLSPSRV